MLYTFFPLLCVKETNIIAFFFGGGRGGGGKIEIVNVQKIQGQ